MPVSDEELKEVLSKNLKEVHIKGLVQGREIALNEILNLMQHGHGLKSLREYIEKGIATLETFEKVVTGDIDKATEKEV